MAVTQSTTNVVKFAAAADALTGRMYVKKFLWDNPTTVGHALSVTDTAGNVLVSSTCAVAKETLQFDFDCAHPIDGIIVATMGSGTLYVYLE